MPKIIEGLRESILSVCRELLLVEGYAALTVRTVAARCGVAVGTVYNYFPSKDLLVASVMLDDWLRTHARMQQGTEAAATMAQGLRSIYDGLVDFSATYRQAWAQYTATGGALSILQKRHGMLVGQLTGIIAPMLARMGHVPDDVCLEIAANTLLTWSQREDCSFDAVAHAMEKLLG